VSWNSDAYISLLAQGVRKEYGSRSARFTAVETVDFEITSASAIGVVGESGSGKSTLSKMLVGLERPTSGRITLNGANIAQLLHFRGGRQDMRTSVQYVAQDTASSFDPRRTLRDAVATPLRTLRGITGSEAEDRIEAVLRVLMLDPRQLDRLPHEVSGGQRQRFSLARALVVGPRILICDEVVSALDVSVQGSVLNTLKDYCENRDVGLAFVSHGLPATAFVTKELVVMRHGHIVERGETSQVINAPSHPYTVTLLEAYRRRRTAATSAAAPTGHAR
jgi:ABC-type dipeptide/oligopeptide/nickel transport system ATPase subunit